MFKRLCAILFAAVFLMVMTLSLVSPIFALLTAGGYLIIVAITIQARAGPAKHSRAIAPRDLLTVILGAATALWPDPDSLSKYRHRHLGSTRNNTGPILAAVSWPPILRCQPISLSAYNARDQGDDLLHVYGNVPISADQGGRALAVLALSGGNGSQYSQIHRDAHGHLCIVCAHLSPGAYQSIHGKIRQSEARAPAIIQFPATNFPSMAKTPMSALMCAA